MIIEKVKNVNYQKEQLRIFGIKVSITFGVLGGLFLWRGEEYYLCFFILSVIFLFLSIIVPALLGPVQKTFINSARILNWVITQFILIILFYFVVSPIGLVIKLLGKGWLSSQKKVTNSYWITKKNTKFEKSHYERQF